MKSNGSNDGKNSDQGSFHAIWMYCLLYLWYLQLGKWNAINIFKLNSTKTFF